MDEPLVDIRSSLKAVCARKDLYEGVQTVSYAVSNRTSLPILQHVLFETVDDSSALRLSAGDMELFISLTIPATIETIGAGTMDAKRSVELLGSLPENEVTLDVDRGYATHLHCAHSDYKLLGLPPEEYPRLPEVPDNDCFTIQQSILRDMVRQTSVAVAKDETRPILTGVLLALNDDTLTLVATDTHRLTYRREPVADAQGSRQAIVPSRAMNELVRILADAPGDVHVSIAENRVKFVTPGGVTFVSRLIEGQFPAFQRVIPTAFTKVLTVPRQSLLQAVRRAEIVARSANHRVMFRSLDDHLAISAEATDSGSAREEVEVMREGDDIETAFNGTYVLDVLNVLDCEAVRFELSESLKPGVLRPVASDPAAPAPDYLCVLMPMQIT